MISGESRRIIHEQTLTDVKGLQSVQLEKDKQQIIYSPMNQRKQIDLQNTNQEGINYDEENMSVKTVNYDNEKQN